MDRMMLRFNSAKSSQELNSAGRRIETDPNDQYDDRFIVTQSKRSNIDSGKASRKSDEANLRSSVNLKQSVIGNFIIDKAE